MCEGRTWGYCSPAVNGIKECPETGDCPEAPMWVIEEGKCTVDDQGCLLSTNYPDPYLADDFCKIAVNPYKALPLRAMEFSLSARDQLRINDVVYSGDKAPDDVLPKGVITWSASTSVEHGSWKLCPFHAEHKEDSTAGGADLAVASGLCVTDVDGCVASPPSTGFDQSAQRCIITVKPGNTKPISVVSFNTEAEYDYLEVNGERYHGTHSPQNVVPTGTITWTSDQENPSVGWKFCLADASEDVREEQQGGQHLDFPWDKDDGEDEFDDKEPREEDEVPRPSGVAASRDADPGGDDDPDGGEDGGKDNDQWDPDDEDKPHGEEPDGIVAGSVSHSTAPVVPPPYNSGLQAPAAGGSMDFLQATAAAPLQPAAAKPKSQPRPRPAAPAAPVPAAASGGMAGRVAWITALVFGVSMAAFIGMRLVSHWRSHVGYDVVSENGSMGSMGGFDVDRRVGSETYGRRQFRDGL